MINKSYRQSFHFWLTVLAALGLIPCSIGARVGLSLNLDVPEVFLVFTWTSIACAAVLYQFAVRHEWNLLKSQWVRLVLAAPMIIIVVKALGFRFGIFLATVGLLVAEFQLREGKWRRILSALALWAYLCIGMLIALTYSTIIVVYRQCTRFDPFFSRVDSFLMFGHSVVQFSRACSFLYHPAEVLYFVMPGVLGAAILFLCLSGDQHMAFEMIGAILVAYFISLAIAYFLPAQGPFVSAGLPLGLISSSLQHTFLVTAAQLYHHQGWLNPPNAYYPAFPSLHVAQPLIAGWWLRRWRMVSAIVGLYCAVLIPAILILQWHYLIDVIAGVALAGLSIFIVSKTGKMIGQDDATPCVIYECDHL